MVCAFLAGGCLDLDGCVRSLSALCELLVVVSADDGEVVVVGSSVRFIPEDLAI